jgi:hypothetical protein
MRINQTIKPRSVARRATLLAAALVLGATAAVAQTSQGMAQGMAQAMAQGMAPGIHGGGYMGGGHIGGEMSAPYVNQVPASPPPVLNQSTPYTVPQSPEAPVSPASPGSVFGND